MSEPVEYTPPVGMQIRVAAEKAIDIAKSINQDLDMLFNGERLHVVRQMVPEDVVMVYESMQANRVAAEPPPAVTCPRCKWSFYTESKEIL